MSLAFNDLLRSRLPAAFAAEHPGYSLVHINDGWTRNQYNIIQTASTTAIGTFTLTLDKGKWSARISNGNHRWYSALRTQKPITQYHEASGKADYEIRTREPFMTIAEYTRIQSQIMRRLLNTASMFDAQFVHSICSQLQQREERKYTVLHEWAAGLKFVRDHPLSNGYRLVTAENYHVQINFHPRQWRDWKATEAPTATPGDSITVICSVTTPGKTEGVRWALTDYGDRLSSSAFDMHDTVLFNHSSIFLAMMSIVHTITNGMNAAVYSPTPTE